MLVQNEVTQTLGALQQFAIHANVVAAGVGLGSQLCDYSAVDLDAALLDEFFGLAAAGYAGLGKNLLEALELGGGTGSRRGFGIRFVFGTVSGFAFEFVFRFGCREGGGLVR